jgi:hypothetical protein
MEVKMTIGYAWEKFHSAVSSLVLLSGTLRTRLISVGVNDIMHVNPKRDLPEELQGKYNEIMEKLTKEGSIADSVEALTDREVNDVAEKIVSLYNEIVRVDATTPHSYLKGYDN